MLYTQSFLYIIINNQVKIYMQSLVCYLFLFTNCLFFMNTSITFF